MLLDQVKGVLVLILIGAAVASAFLGDLQDAIAILAIVVINAAVGVRQEYRAEKALAALKEQSTPGATVRRAGRVEQVPSRQLVPVISSCSKQAALFPQMDA